MRLFSPIALEVSRLSDGLPCPPSPLFQAIILPLLVYATSARARWTTQIQTVKAGSVLSHQPQPYHQPRNHCHARRIQPATHSPALSLELPLRVTRRGLKTSARGTTTRLRPHPQRPKTKTKWNRCGCGARVPNPSADAPQDEAVTAEADREWHPALRNRHPSRRLHTCYRGRVRAAACGQSRRTTTAITSHISLPRS